MSRKMFLQMAISHIRHNAQHKLYLCKNKNLQLCFFKENSFKKIFEYDILSVIMRLFRLFTYVSNELCILLKNIFTTLISCTLNVFSQRRIVFYDF